MSNLRRKWFPDDNAELEREQAIREEIAARRDRAAEWVTAEYMKEFKEKLETWLMAHEPKPAGHEEMLFTSGVRKGVLMVKDHIAMLERQIRESRNVGN